MATELTVEPADLLSSDYAIGAGAKQPPFTPGTTYRDQKTGKRYMFVIATTSTFSLIAGRPMYWGVMPNKYTVLSSTAGTEGTFAGVMLNTVTSGNGCWIQIPFLETEAEILVTNAAATKSNLTQDNTNGVLKVLDTTSAATAGGAGVQIIAVNKETGLNPATPLTTTCVFV